MARRMEIYDNGTWKWVDAAPASDPTPPSPSPPPSEPEPEPEPEPTPEPVSDHPTLQEQGFSRIIVDESMRFPKTGVDSAQAKQIVKQEIELDKNHPYVEVGLLVTAEAHIDPSDKAFVFPAETNTEQMYEKHRHLLLGKMRFLLNHNKYRVYIWGKKSANTDTLYVSHVRSNSLHVDYNTRPNDTRDAPYLGPDCDMPGTYEESRPPSTRGR